MPTLADIKLEHEKLYGDYMAHAEELVKNPAAFPATAAEGLVDSMVDLSQNLTSNEDFEWLRSALEKWRTIFVTVLRIPKPIRIEAPAALQPPIETETMMWAESDIDRWVNHRAHELAVERAVRKHRAMTLAQMLAEKPSTPEEAKTDFEIANVYLASEILDGRIGIAQLRPGCYRRLQSVWLEDVKRLKAYHAWLARGDGFDPVHAEKDYWDACYEIARLLLIQEKCWGQGEFDPVHAHLEEICLTDDRFDARKAHGLIAIKAHRLWTMGSRGRDHDWSTAERYVHEFYESVVAAVRKQDPAAAVRVIGLLNNFENEDRNYLIVNAFETAVAARFVTDRSLSKAFAHRA